MRFEILFVTLFTVATAVALVARWLKTPYTVALVVTGVALGSAHLLAPPHLTKELLYAVFLPGLLFEAAFHLEVRHFVQNRVAITALAVPGLVAAMVLTAVLLVPSVRALHIVEGFGLVHGLVFGSLIAATDPIAVVALFRRLGAPKRLAVLVEGESLLNDGTAVVVFTIIAAAALSGAPVSGHTLAGAVVDFVRMVGMGALVGVAAALGVAQISKRVDDPMIEITLTTICSYGSFVVAEQFHFSGVIATVAAGMVCGSFTARTGMSPSTRLAVESFWEYVAFALNSIVFLLIGFAVRVDLLFQWWLPIVVAWVAMTVARAALIAVVGALLTKSRERIPWRWGVVITWGGLRGALSMVLVLALPADFAHRELLVTMTFGVVLVSILVQGLTMSPLLRWLGITGRLEDRAACEQLRGVTLSKRAALAELDKMLKAGIVSADAGARLRTEYDSAIADAEAKLADVGQATHRDDEIHAARRHLLMTEKQSVMDALRSGVVGNETTEALLRDVDANLVELDRGDDDAT